MTVSVVAEVLHLPPDVAERQDYSLVMAILEYREVKEALRIEAEGTDWEREYIAKHPEMAVSLLAIQKAHSKLYSNPELLKAVEVFRRAQREWVD